MVSNSLTSGRATLQLNPGKRFCWPGTQFLPSTVSHVARAILSARVG